MTQKRRAISTPGERREAEMRSSTGVVMSVLVHLVVVVALVRVLLVPSGWLTQFPEHSPTVEHIGVITLPKPDEANKEKPKAGGDNRPVNGTPVKEPPQIVAPTVVPTSIAPPSTEKAAPPAGGGYGAMVGGGGPTRGISPAYTDPRLWVQPGTQVSAPLSPRQRMDSVIATNFGAMLDSINAIPTERQPGDWTVKHNGKTYGIDPKYIHLGSISLPTALLALLPINSTANPQSYEKNQRLSQMRSEILQQAARMQRDDDFKAAVRDLRERKEKERADKKAAAGPVVVPPGDR